jgi:hypothetical protein
MTHTTGLEEWRVLCEMASKEMDSDKLMDLVGRINCALDHCNQRSHKAKIELATVIPPRTSIAADENSCSYSIAQVPLTAEHDC